MAQVRWYEKRIVQATEQKAMVWMISSGKEAARRTQRTIGRLYPPASRPGEPPRKRTGRLQKGVKATWTFKTTTVRVVSEAPYSLFLEKGTRKMSARPFILGSLQSFQVSLKKRINRPRPF